jgi:hypothetical protein
MFIRPRAAAICKLARAIAVLFLIHFSEDMLYAAPVCAVTITSIRREGALSSERTSNS